MSTNNVILLNGLLNLGVILAVATAMVVPFTLDRRKQEPAELYAFAAPLREDLAA